MQKYRSSNLFPWIKASFFPTQVGNDIHELCTLDQRVRLETTQGSTLEDWSGVLRSGMETCAETKKNREELYKLIKREPRIPCEVKTRKARAVYRAGRLWLQLKTTDYQGSWNTAPFECSITSFFEYWQLKGLHLVFPLETISQDLRVNKKLQWMRQSHTFSEECQLIDVEEMTDLEKSPFSQKVQNSNYKINQSWGYNVQQGDYS